MADAQSKITVFFHGAGTSVSTGWTETFWSSEANLQVAVTECKRKYIPRRKELLGNGATITHVRATSVPSTRLSYIEFIRGKDGEGNFFTKRPSDDFDPTQVDLLCRLQTANGHRRQLWLGGLPDSVTDTIVAQGIDAAFISSPLFKQLGAAIVDLQYAIRWKMKDGSAISYHATPITEVFPIMVRNRKRGRPFFLFRGRRTA